MDKLDFVVLSPGVPTDLPLVNAMRDKKISIIGEIELAYQVAKGKILAITGTNGKTTTTTLVGEILSNYFKDVKVVGNIGIPYTSVAGRYHRRNGNSSRNQQLPVRDNCRFCSGCICYFKYYTGSSEPSSYHGKLY